MSVVEGPIEETVELNLEYPSVSERYFTKYYFIPKERKKAETSSNGSNGVANETEQSSSAEPEKGTKDEDSRNAMDERSSPLIQEEKKERVKFKKASAQHDSSGHTCVMVHSNKLCLVTMSHQHPVIGEKKEVVEVILSVFL